MKTDKFDCDRLAVEEVCAYEQAKLARPCRKSTGNWEHTLEDDAKGALADLLSYAKVGADDAC